jgi:hypothetical protein
MGHIGGWVTEDRANVALIADMKEHFVIDPLISKRQQLLLATQLCRMVLKVRIVTFLPCFVTYRHLLHRTPLGVTPFPAIPSASPFRPCYLALLKFLPCILSLDRGSGEARSKTHGCLYAGLHCLLHTITLCYSDYPHRWCACKHN